MTKEKAYFVQQFQRPKVHNCGEGMVIGRHSGKTRKL